MSWVSFYEQTGAWLFHSSVTVPELKIFALGIQMSLFFTSKAGLECWMWLAIFATVIILFSPCLLCAYPRPECLLLVLAFQNNHPVLQGDLWVGSSLFSLIICLLSSSRMDIHDLSLSIPLAKKKALSWVFTVIRLDNELVCVWLISEMTSGFLSPFLKITDLDKKKKKIQVCKSWKSACPVFTLEEGRGEEELPLISWV